MNPVRICNRNMSFDPPIRKAGTRLTITRHDNR